MDHASSAGSILRIHEYCVVVASIRVLRDLSRSDVVLFAAHFRVDQQIKIEMTLVVVGSCCCLV